MRGPDDRRASVSVDQRALQAYLATHLAGAQVAERLAAALRDDESLPVDVRKQCSRFLRQLREDKEHLRNALSLFGGVEGPYQRLARGVGAALRRSRGLLPPFEKRQPFVEVEFLAVGVAGKRLLWSTLKKAEGLDGRLARIPTDALIARAHEQERALIGLRDRLMVPFLMDEAGRTETARDARNADNEVDAEAEASFPASDAPNHWARETRRRR